LLKNRPKITNPSTRDRDPFNQTATNTTMSQEKMNQFILENLVKENERLKRQLDVTREAIHVSEACKDLIAFVSSAVEPFDKGLS
jgi:hypothetical protein